MASLLVFSPAKDVINVAVPYFFMITWKPYFYMLTWKQSTGELFGPDGSSWGKGYSGHKEGVNNPALQSQPNVGPIPQGKYQIGPPYDSPHTGPFTLPLAATPDSNTFGRSDFRIHGDLVGSVGLNLASHGCIILARPIRERINAVEDRTLLVVA